MAQTIRATGEMELTLIPNVRDIIGGRNVSIGAEYIGCDFELTLSMLAAVPQLIKLHGLLYPPDTVAIPPDMRKPLSYVDMNNIIRDHENVKSENEFLRGLIKDLQEESSAYSRGLEDGIGMQ